MNLAAARMTFPEVDIAYRDSHGSNSKNDPDVHPVPVILVHGMGGDGSTWDRFARELIHHRRRVIVMDLRGHGRSAHASSYLFDEFADDLRRLCEHLELTRVDLVGHSLGGYATSVVAMDRPDLVRRLVIEECPLPYRTGDPQAPLTGRFPSLPELWHATSSIVRHPRAVLAFDRSMTSSALAQFRQPKDNWWQRLPEIKAKTLILRGGPGGMVDPIRLEAMVDAIPQARVVVFKTGHSIHRDGYHSFAGTVLPFLMAES